MSKEIPKKCIGFSWNCVGCFVFFKGRIFPSEFSDLQTKSSNPTSWFLLLYYLFEAPYTILAKINMRIENNLGFWIRRRIEIYFSNRDSEI